MTDRRVPAGVRARARDARFSQPALRAFELLFNPWRRARLRTCSVLPDPTVIPTGMPLVMVANHVSWWDGFLLLDVRERLRPDAPLFTMMSEAELATRPFLRLLGAVPLAPRPGAVLRALRALQNERKRNPELCIGWFPQGRIRPSWHRPLDMRRGISLLIEHLAPVAVLPVALHIEPLRRAAPTAFVLAGRPLRSDDVDVSVRAIEDAVTRLSDRLLAHIATTGEDAADLLSESALPHTAQRPVEPTAPAAVANLDSGAIPQPANRGGSRG